MRWLLGRGDSNQHVVHPTPARLDVLWDRNFESRRWSHSGENKGKRKSAVESRLVMLAFRVADFAHGWLRRQNRLFGVRVNQQTGHCFGKRQQKFKTCSFVNCIKSKIWRPIYKIYRCQTANAKPSAIHSIVTKTWEKYLLETEGTWTYSVDFAKFKIKHSNFLKYNIHFILPLIFQKKGEKSKVEIQGMYKSLRFQRYEVKLSKLYYESSAKICYTWLKI